MLSRLRYIFSYFTSLGKKDFSRSNESNFLSYFFHFLLTSVNPPTLVASLVQNFNPVLHAIFLNVSPLQNKSPQLIQSGCSIEDPLFFDKLKKLETRRNYSSSIVPPLLFRIGVRKYVLRNFYLKTCCVR